MIRANELMIGDWVKSRGKIEQVKSVYDGFICTDSFEDSHDYYFEPIPLTPEILEKNRWKKDSGGEECWANSKGWFTPHEYGKRDTIKSWEVEICGKPSCFDGVIKYVHELQHALRICGIKHDIKL